MGNKQKLALGVLTVLVATSVIGYAVASYVMTTPTITVTVTKAETMGIASSSQTIVEGQTLTLTATISDQRNGVVVTFYQDGVSCGQATSMGGGIATLTLTPSQGTHSYYAVASHP